MEYCSKKKKKKAKVHKEKGEKLTLSSEAMSSPLAVAKAAYKNLIKAVEAVNLAITMEGAKAFKLYRNLLYNKARKPWEKNI